MTDLEVDSALFRHCRPRPPMASGNDTLQKDLLSPSSILPPPYLLVPNAVIHHRTPSLFAFPPTPRILHYDNSDAAAQS